MLVPPSQHAGPSVSNTKDKEKPAHSRSHSAHEEMKGEGEAAAQRFCWRAAPKGAVFLGTPQGRCGQAHMIKSKLQHDQPGIRHANYESDTRIGPRTDLGGRPALVAFRGRSRASSPASNESEGDEHEQSHVACHPSSCTANRTISSRISCHITFFRATSAGTREPSTIEEDSLGWKTELIVLACLYRKVAIAGNSNSAAVAASCGGSMNKGRIKPDKTG